MGSITRRAASYDALQYIRCDAAAVKRGTVIGFTPAERAFAFAKSEVRQHFATHHPDKKKGRTGNRYGPKSREETPKNWAATAAPPSARYRYEDTLRRTNGQGSSRVEWTKNPEEVQEFRGVMPVLHALHARWASVQVQHEHLPA